MKSPNHFQPIPTDTQRQQSSHVVNCLVCQMFSSLNLADLFFTCIILRVCFTVTFLDPHNLTRLDETCSPCQAPSCPSRRRARPICTPSLRTPPPSCVRTASTGHTPDLQRHHTAREDGARQRCVASPHTTTRATVKAKPTDTPSFAKMATICKKFTRYGSDLGHEKPKHLSLIRSEESE